MQTMASRWSVVGLGLGLLLPACTRVNPAFGASETDAASGSANGTGASGTPTGGGSNSGGGGGSNSMSGSMPTDPSPTGTVGTSIGATTDDPTDSDSPPTTEAGSGTGIKPDTDGETESEGESSTGFDLSPPCEEVLGDHCYDMTVVGNLLLDRAGDADLEGVSGAQLQRDEWGPVLDCSMVPCDAAHGGVDLGSDGITLEVWFEFTQLNWAGAPNQPIFDITAPEGGVAIEVGSTGGNGVIAHARFGNAGADVTLSSTLGRQCIALVSAGVGSVQIVNRVGEVLNMQELSPTMGGDFSNAGLELGPIIENETSPVIVYGVRIHSGPYGMPCRNPVP